MLFRSLSQSMLCFLIGTKYLRPLCAPLSNNNFLRISSWNVNSLTQSKFKTFSSLIQDSDIFALIDSRISPKQTYYYRVKNKKSYVSHTLEATKSKGILIFYPPSLSPSFDDIVPGQLVNMTFEINAFNMSIQFVYGPSDKDRPAFLDNIVFPQDDNTKLILVGDWNIVQLQ